MIMKAFALALLALASVIVAFQFPVRRMQIASLNATHGVNVHPADDAVEEPQYIGTWVYDGSNITRIA